MKNNQNKVFSIVTLLFEPIKSEKEKKKEKKRQNRLPFLCLKEKQKRNKLSVLNTHDAYP